MSLVPVLNPDTAARRQKFFKFLFDRAGAGYVCIARRRPTGAFAEKFFLWPEETADVEGYITQHLTDHNMWFCPMLFDEPRRAKATVGVCPTAWSDLDACPPDKLLVAPTLLVETSTRRHQAIWCFDELVRPQDAEEVSKRIAYYHAEDGADKSGWDLTQLLRIPFTHNFKYTPPVTVKLVGANDIVSLEHLLRAYPDGPTNTSTLFPFPEHIMDGEELLQLYRDKLDSKVWMLLRVPPDRDWSKALWQLEMRLAESGLDKDEIFAIVRTAACNKYARDNRDERMLWREVCKAWLKVKDRNTIASDTTIYKPPELLTDADIESVKADKTFVEEYTLWASSVGDAAESYHPAGAFTVLSSLMSGSVELPTSFGVIKPNLWFLLLADTTLTRKSTALDLAVDLLVQVDPDTIMATDGSIEGMFSALSVRPGQPSIFLRDEFSGLIEMMTKKDYYAGMGEALTKMYDGKLQKRVLRRETITVQDPILIIFAGGIRTKILSLLTTEQVTSGFLPRFIFITAKSDLNRLQPLGPPNEQVTTERDRLLDIMQEYKLTYNRSVDVTVGGKTLTTKNVRQAKLTSSAWHLYNEMERKLLETGVKSTHTAAEILTPVMDRLAKSGLKAAMLIAASRLPTNVVVEDRDIYHAFYYVSQWREYAVDVVSHIGLPQQERLITSVLDVIIKHPGVLRSTLMGTFHLTKRDAEMIFDTLEQRGQIERVRNGKTEALSPIKAN